MTGSFEKRCESTCRNQNIQELQDERLVRRLEEKSNKRNKILLKEEEIKRKKQTASQGIRSDFALKLQNIYLQPQLVQRV
jgi:hypothetical protein